MVYEDYQCNTFIGILVWSVIVGRCRDNDVAIDDYVVANGWEVLAVPVRVGSSGYIYRDSSWGVVILDVSVDGIPLKPRKVTLAGITGDKDLIKVGAKSYMYLEMLPRLRAYPENTSIDACEQNEYLFGSKYKEAVVRYKARYPDGSFGDVTSIRLISVDRLLDLTSQAKPVNPNTSGR